jgi:hypothetical protein
MANNFSTRFILLDGEYGGVKSRGVHSHDYSILELSFAVTDENLDVIKTLDLKIKPDDDKYIVSAGGLAANKINLVAHDKVAVTFGKSKELLYNFLKENSNDGAIKLIPLGKGIVGDIRYIIDQKLISEHSWRQFCSDQIIDFGGIIMLLKVLGVYPQTFKQSTGKMSNSLEALAEHLNINTSNIHSAKADVELYVAVCKHLFSLLKKHLPKAKLPFKNP